MNNINTHDEFAHLRDPHWPAEVKDPKIISFLEDENAKVKAFFDPLEPQIETVFNEIKAHIPLKDSTPPVKNGRFSYYKGIGENDEYWTYYRKTESVTQHILNVNYLAKGHEFCNVTAVTPSPDNEYIAYAINLEGGEDYQIIVKHINQGTLISNSVKNVFGQIIWDKQSLGFFYIPCGENWRAQKVMYHHLKDNTDTLVYEEKDPKYWVEIDQPTSLSFLFIYAKTGEQNEVWVLDTKKISLQTPYLFKSRNDGHLTKLTQRFGASFFALINDRGKNFRLIQTAEDGTATEIQEIIPHDKDVYLEDIEGYLDFLVVSKKRLGVPEISVLDYKTLSEKFSVDFSKHTQSSSFDASIMRTDFESEVVRYSYSALNEPTQVWEYNKSTHKCIKRVTLKGFESKDYEIDRIYATSDDGTQIPISLIYKKSTFKKDGSNPLYLYGYGSYGIAMTPHFRPHIFPLIDRGFVYAIAHIRGGSDLGYYWYESAKFLTKKRTFEDFISCAKHLSKTGHTTSGNIAIDGRSAGGMLIGYAINNAPELFKAAILGVPFVDVLNTMLDETLPLTATEFEEWGNPKDPVYRDYIESYSPYDNVKAQDYPAIFMNTGIKDPRVGYWEPAKFLAKLKKMKTDKNPLLLHTNMSAGHFGKSSRFDVYKEYAQEYTFILKSFGIN